MEEEEVSVHGEGAPRVQHKDLRLQLEGSERPRVVRWQNYSRKEEATFITGLKLLFLLLLIWTIINLIVTVPLIIYIRLPYQISSWDYIFNQRWLFANNHITQKGILTLAVFVAAALVGAFVKKTKSAASAAPRREQEKTSSALLQQV